MKNTDDMVLYEVLTPEKIAALLAQQDKRGAPPAEEPPQPIMEADAIAPDAEEAAAQPADQAEPSGLPDEAAAETAPAEPEPADVAAPAEPEEPEEAETEDVGVTVIDVCFKSGGKAYYFDPAGAEVRSGDGVIVETVRGMEFGDVVRGCHDIPASQVIGELKPITRVATSHDRELRAKNRAKEKDAYAVCMQKIQEHRLDMKLVDVEYAFNGAKVIFYFTADGRVDFRELVKDLATVFKTRIELRQIGVRDEAKLLGGLGSCGRPVCCKQFLPDFQPVSIKMAKDQSLSLSPTKISGICGRLMCCLKYEQDTYERMRKRMPRVGREVMAPDGQGTVLENNVITEKTRLKMVLPDGTIDVRWYPFEELSITDAPRREPAPRPVKVERLSRRERLLQEQQARKAAAEAAANAPDNTAAANTAQAAAPEGAAPEGTAKRKRPRRNRRRGGGQSAGGQSNGGQPNGGQSNGGAAPDNN